MSDAAVEQGKFDATIQAISQAEADEEARLDPLITGLEQAVNDLRTQAAQQNVNLTPGLAVLDATLAKMREFHAADTAPGTPDVTPGLTPDVTAPASQPAEPAAPVTPPVAGTQVAGTQVAGTQVAGTQVAGTQVAAPAAVTPPAPTEPGGGTAAGGTAPGA